MGKVLEYPEKELTKLEKLTLQWHKIQRNKNRPARRLHLPHKHLIHRVVPHRKPQPRQSTYMQLSTTIERFMYGLPFTHDGFEGLSNKKTWEKVRFLHRQAQKKWWADLRQEEKNAIVKRRTDKEEAQRLRAEEYHRKQIRDPEWQDIFIQGLFCRLGKLCYVCETPIPVYSCPNWREGMIVGTYISCIFDSCAYHRQKPGRKGNCTFKVKRTRVCKKAICNDVYKFIWSGNHRSWNGIKLHHIRKAENRMIWYLGKYLELLIKLKTKGVKPCQKKPMDKVRQNRTK